MRQLIQKFPTVVFQEFCPHAAINQFSKLHNDSETTNTDPGT